MDILEEESAVSTEEPEVNQQRNIRSKVNLKRKSKDLMQSSRQGKVKKNAVSADPIPSPITRKSARIAAQTKRIFRYDETSSEESQ